MKLRIVTHLFLTGPLVHTKLGSLRGAFMTAKGKETVISSYFGVPFAKPPVGPLRLAPPQPAEAWQGVRDATKQPPMCLQAREVLLELLANFSMSVEVPEVSEDCLYLNIYTPSKPGDNSKLPVMVWIHGGGFSAASASIFDGLVLAAYQDVVVVLIQYRLGLLGFFSTGDEHAPGNYGLLDQVAALQWVQENIHSFGGDPELVTIFGESAGGVSVSLHVLSPLSSNLFRYAIAESGTAAMDAIMSPNPLPTAQYVGNTSGCDISSTKKMVDCVMQLTEEDILKIAKVCITTIHSSFHPYTLNAIFNRVLLIFQNQVFAEFVLNEYLGTSSDRIKIREGFREMMGDFFFNIPARKVSNYHRDAGAPVYMYEFQHSPSLLKKNRPSFVGCDHGDDMFFVLGYCFGRHLKVQDEFSEEENELCKTVMAYWGNFARTGSPNGPGLTKWPEYGDESEYLGIGLEQKPGKNFKGKHFDFMTQKLPQIIKEWKEGKLPTSELV
uniref:Carboxylic ester hydrolase n=1 Tax=Cyprinus carpio TaxID=7962 RepID=A0A8C1WC11_CYPCA